ncbi:hypothetical protein AGABI2DRAFT_123249 [Agaricus bisporus var. bisporus H97]|uniref:hypothetical protein n=1 Tax=Agaricus bisporus var. bisporus (strain H97 / ATCC MYA-4626 / FGSC 10389) TaxID=936046 RepID=UPI00029F6E18|nr:hypothetical protein AGABI2DRAFT_123249 [Agaricus bisporus var. bisporus H97]EKV41768.1 hypothetical protein AGABI2DRAFT_123249 [Agaricus bisporus var. bisporus H97]
MDAAQLARWTRFAAKGGIGKCTATYDCVAQGADDLMFFEASFSVGDEIVVLMRIANVEDCYLGSCEGVIGRFRGQDVHFHGKLKRPVMTKRSSVAAAKSPSPNAGVQTPTSSLSRSNSLSKKEQDSPLQSVPGIVLPPVLSADDETSNPPPLTISASSTPPVPIVVTPQHTTTQSPSRSIGPTSTDLSSPKKVIPPPSLSPRIVLSTSPPVSPAVVSPLNIVKKKSHSPSTFNSTFAAAQEQLLRAQTLEPKTVSDYSFSTYDEPSSTSSGGDNSDGEVGIGLSFLQSLADGTDSDDDSVEHASTQNDDEDTADGFLYDEPHYRQATEATSDLIIRNSTEQGDACSQTVQQSVIVFPSGLPSPQSPNSSKSLSSYPSPHHRSSVSSQHPSVQSSSSWDGDIYDNYRYSRASMASRARMSSASSRASIKGLARDAWDGHVYEQPPPIPDSRPSIDSALMSELSTKSWKENARKSAESRKSTDTRRSAGSRKSSESESRRSRQELLFPQPPTNVNIQPDLLDQATRESLRRSSEASRVRTPADFRLSVESEASVYSHLSIMEQESPTSEATSPLSSIPPKHDSKVLRPPSLELSETHSPLLRTSWSSIISSPTGSSFASAPTVSPATPLLMPTALTSLASGMGSVIREKAEMDRQAEDKLESDSEIKGEENLRNIVVDDEEEIPSEVILETTSDNEDSPDTFLDASKDTIVLPESLRATAKGYPEPQAPSRSLLQPPSVHGGSADPPTPDVYSQTFIRGGPSAVQLSESLSFQSMPSTLTMQAMANHLRSPRPTLADLREGGGVVVPGTGQRRSLFNPHPNAPKAPTLISPGPMFIASQEPSLRHPPVVPDAPPKPSIFEVMHMALHSPVPPALRPRLMSKGPTIYGRTDIDLSMSITPVPITFSIEPFPYQPPDASHFLQQQLPLPQPLLRQPSPHPQSPLQQSFASHSPSFTSGVQQPPAVVISRSASGSPILRPERKSTSGDEGTRTPNGNATGSAGGAVPREGFLSKTSGMRPRSRSFSSLDLQLTSAETTLVRGSPPARTIPDLPRSLMPSVRRSSTISSSQELATINKSPPLNSPLRPSPLNSSPQKLGFANSGPKSPSSPLSQFYGASSNANPPPSPSTPSIQTLQIPRPLRQATSSVTLDESTLSGSSLSLNNDPESSSSNSKPSSQEPPASRDHVQSGDQAEFEPTTPQNDNPTSPIPPIHRQLSLRAKLSLPNLRRNWNKPEEMPIPSPRSEHEVSGTVQVEDLDFELIRPTLPFQNARTSEDSVSRETIAEMSVQDGEPLQHPGSPTSSVGGAKSPATAESFSWPRPSVSSSAPPIITRATADAESNMDAHRQRETKWMSFIGSLPPSQWRKSKKVKKLIHEGVPSSVRYLIWSNLTDGKAKVVPGVYYQLGNRDRIPVANMIEEDIRACFQDQPHLQGKRGPVLALLQAYLTMVPDVQYTMGLTLIAGQLLLHAPEEDAFWIFISVMNTHIRPYFSSNSSQMEVDATLFNRVVENNDAQLAKKLYSELGIEPMDVCAPWFSTLFVRALPPERPLPPPRATSADDVLQYLSHPPAGWLPSTPDGFLSLVHSVKMKDDDIRKTRLKMEAQVKRQVQAQNPRHLPITTTISLPRP